ncbi:MAG: patatin-like phospholipase family protein [Burkholderiales bacterium]
MLSGGGARGFAHIGVLRWLEANRVPIDCVVGTSMGAVIGGLYASGLSIDRIEAAMRATDWSELRGPDAPRPNRPPRRQEEDYEYTLPLELRVQGGRAVLPSSVFGGARFEQRLREWIGPRPRDEAFDALPIPFRAVATRLGTGEARVLDRGDLALAIRASMSVPGLFEPTRIDGGLYVDGGLVSNLPVDAAYALGAERVIAVNVGTGLADESTLGSFVDVSVQTLAILTEQNVRTQLTRMRPGDVLITPPLDDLTFLDFPRVGDGMAAGTRGAEAQRGRLLAMAVPEPRWEARRAARAAPVPEIEAVGPNERAAAATTAAATAAAASSSPDTVRFGLSLGTDFTTGTYRLNVGHRRLTPDGIEWRNGLEIGRIHRIGSDLFVPIDRTGLVAVVPYAEASRQSIPIYVGERRITSYLVQRAGIGLDAATQSVGVGELRLGPMIERVRLSFGERTLFDFGGRDIGDLPSDQLGTFGTLRLRYRRDTLDAPFLPRTGSRVSLDWAYGANLGPDGGRFQYGAVEGQWFGSVGRNTFEVYGQFGGPVFSDGLYPQWFTLGGFQRLSGYSLDQFSGQAIAFGRLQWRRSLGEGGALGDRTWVGGTLEVGRIGRPLDDAPTVSLSSSVSGFVATETPLGPLHFAVGVPRNGVPRFYLFLGRP